MILHLLVLLVFQLLGEVLARSLGLLIPGPVVGLVLLLAFFLALPKVSAAVRPTANGLLSHLSLLFVPAGVGVVAHIDVLGSNGLPLFLALVVSTLASITVGALVFTGVARLVGVQADE